MRRLSIRRPIWTADAARLVAIFALYVVAMSVLVIRFDVVGVREGLAALAGGLAVAVIALALALAAFVRIWRSGVAGAGRAFMGFLLAAALLTPAIYYAARAIEAPRINDVTTDFEDPPQLRVAALLRAPDANEARYDPALIARQKQAYPEIHPLLVDLPPDEVRKLVLALVRERKWRIIADSPLVEYETKGRVPVRTPAGRIEAVARSLVLGLEDDVVVRIRDDDGRTRVDMRSASRYGPLDFGGNADRVSEFLEALRMRALIPVQADE